VSPELRETASGKHVTTVRVASNGKTHDEFHDVALWSGTSSPTRHEIPWQGPPRGRASSTQTATITPDDSDL
jgi:hypothetical protein